MVATASDQVATASDQVIKTEAAIIVENVVRWHLIVNYDS